MVSSCARASCEPASNNPIRKNIFVMLLRRDMAFIEQAGGPCAQIKYSILCSPAFTKISERIFLYALHFHGCRHAAMG
jgi:hypothetical protein